MFVLDRVIPRFLTQASLLGGPFPSITALCGVHFSNNVLVREYAGELFSFLLCVLFPAEVFFLTLFYILSTLSHVH